VIPAHEIREQAKRQAVEVMTVVTGDLSFRLADNPFFEALARSGLSRRMLAAKLKETAKGVRSKLRQTLARAVACSAALDEWFGLNRVKYGPLQVAIVTGDGGFGTACLGHIPMDDGTAHTQALQYGAMLEEFGLRNKVKYITTDNASVCAALVAELACEQVGCAAHAFNLLLHDLVKAEMPRLQGLLQLTGRSRHTDGFKKICVAAGKKRTSLTTFSTTRFYSLQKLLDNALELRSEVEAFAIKLASKQAKPRSSPFKRRLAEAFDEHVAKEMTLEEALEPSLARVKQFVGEVPQLDRVKKGLEVAEFLSPIVEQFSLQTHLVERDGFLTLGEVMPALFMIDRELHPDVLDRRLERLTPAWDNAKTEHWNKIFPPQTRRLMDAAFLLVPDGRHELVLGEDRVKDAKELLRAMVAAEPQAAAPTPGTGGATQASTRRRARSNSEVFASASALSGDDVVEKYWQLREKEYGSVRTDDRLRW
jgi:hypothetical protein